MRRLRHLLCILAVFSTGLTTAMFGQGAPITDDAYVSSATPTANNGTSPSLVVQNPGGFSYIRFDLARVLPANTSPYSIAASMVAKATLKIYASAVTAGPRGQERGLFFGQQFGVNVANAELGGDRGCRGRAVSRQQRDVVDAE